MTSEYCTRSLMLIDAESFVFKVIKIATPSRRRVKDTGGQPLITKTGGGGAFRVTSVMNTNHQFDYSVCHQCSCIQHSWTNRKFWRSSGGVLLISLIFIDLLSSDFTLVLSHSFVGDLIERSTNPRLKYMKLDPVTFSIKDAVFSVSTGPPWSGRSQH